jgi:hypothetical protein
MKLEHHHCRPSPAPAAVPELRRSAQFKTPHLMKILHLLAIALLWSLNLAQGAEDKPLLDLVPTLAELGEGWTSNNVAYWIDPLCHPSEGAPGVAGNDPVGFMRRMHQGMKSGGITGCMNISLTHRDTTNQEYHVWIERYSTPKALDADHAHVCPGGDPLEHAPTVGFGEKAHWLNWSLATPIDRTLHVPLRQYLVRIQAHYGEEANFMRLAEVLKAKITRPALQEKTFSPSSAQSAEPVTSPNAAAPHR